MAAVPVTIVGIETRDDGSSGAVTIVGMATVSGLVLGGGPSPGGQPPRPWGPINYPDQSLPGSQPHPDQGLPGRQPYPDQGLPGNQPYPGQGLPGNQPYPGQGLPGNQPYPGQGLPGNQPYPDQGLPPILPVPPGTPNVPPPGSPPVIVGGGQPVHGIVPPDAIIVDYPGVGKVVVPKPTETMPPGSEQSF